MVAQSGISGWQAPTKLQIPNRRLLLSGAGVSACQPGLLVSSECVSTQPNLADLCVEPGEL
jgi:hypothetical protein